MQDKLLVLVQIYKFLCHILFGIIYFMAFVHCLVLKIVKKL
jgi:hypothetical protein